MKEWRSVVFRIQLGLRDLHSGPWAEEQSARTQRTGQPLDTTGLALAARVGVQHPERIRTQLVDALTLPEEPALRQAALATGLLVPV